MVSVSSHVTGGGGALPHETPTSLHAEVSCVIKEEPTGTVRVSLRSLGNVDVCRIAEREGGGGHRFAAGFTSSDPIPEVIERIKAAL